MITPDKYSLILLLALCPGVPAGDAVVDAMHSSAMGWRARYGLSRQRLDESLCRIAQQHAEYMVRTGWYNHGPNDQVIHRGPVDARGAVSGWMRSGPHAAWLLGGHRRCGWGHAVSAGGTHYWCGVFR